MRRRRGISELDYKDFVDEVLCCVGVGFGFAGLRVGARWEIDMVTDAG